MHGRLTPTRGRINFFGGLGGFFIKGGVDVTRAVTRYAFGNVVTPRYAISLQAIPVPLLLHCRRAATVSNRRSLSALIGPRQLRRYLGDEKRGRTSVEQFLKQGVVHAARASAETSCRDSERCFRPPQTNGSVIAASGSSQR